MTPGREIELLHRHIEYQENVIGELITMTTVLKMKQIQPEIVDLREFFTGDTHDDDHSTRGNGTGASP